MSLNIAAGLHLGGNESYPDVFEPFGGFADSIAVEDGYVGLPDIPGIGFEAKLRASKRRLTTVEVSSSAMTAGPAMRAPGSRSARQWIATSIASPVAGS